MGRRLSTCLVLLRLFQLLAAFVPGTMNGWLAWYLYTNKLGPSEIVLVLEVLVAAVFVYSSLSLFIIHTRHRSRKTAWMVCTIGLDMLFCFFNVTIVSLLSFTGLPSNCSGLTSSIWAKGDKANLPSRGYTTIRFSNEQNGHRGELDRYCSMERGFFFCSILAILAFIITIILSVCRIFEINYTRNSEIQYLLDEREEMLRLELKVQEQEVRSQPESPPLGSSQPATTMPKFTRDEEAAIEASVLASLGRPAARPSSSPSNRLPASSSSSQLMSGGGGGGGSGSVELPSIPEAASSSSSPSPHQYPHQHASSLARSSALPTSSIPVVDDPGLLLDPSEVHANLAMVTDGSRYGGHPMSDHNQLPPYSPGNRRTMDGHGDEDNEMRLSEYVKGETRAQDMKDHGSYQ